MKDLEDRKEKYCLNCKEEINYANYCHRCGQKNSHKKISLVEILKEFFSEYFTFDSKFFRSINPLLFKPAHLTREYIDGKRASYIFPLRLYVFTTFIFFFVLALNTKLDKNNFNGFDNSKSADSVKTVNISDSLVSKDKSDKTETLDYKSDGLAFSFSMNEDDTSGFSGYLNKKGQMLADMGDQGKILFGKELINQIPKIMFFLLPIFALILKLIYIRHKIYYVEHLIFALHIHTFLFIVLFILVLFISKYIVLGITLLFLVYLFFSIKNFYEQSYLKTVLKYVILVGSYLVLLIPTVILLIILAVVSI